MKILNPQFNKTLYFLYFVIGVLFSCVAIVIRITERDGPGDLPQDFQILGITTIAGLVLGVILFFVIRNYELKNKIIYCLWIFIRYFLSLVFFCYGFVKVIGLQFGKSLEMLDMKVLDLTKNDMSVAWFFFGHSNAYEVFLGWGETVAAFLLLFRKTSILGAFLLLTILSNIVAVNYWYDVNVKLNSTFYLLMTFWVLIYQYQRLVDFFILSKSTNAPIFPDFFFSPKKSNFIKIANMVIIVSIIGYSAWDNFYRFPKEYGLDKKSTLKGVWKVNELNTELKDTLWTDKIKQAKFYFDDYGQGTIKNNYTTLSSFSHSEKLDSIHISQITYDSSYEMKGVFKIDSNSLQIKGEWFGKPTIITLNKLSEYFVDENIEINHKEISVDTTELIKFVGKYKVASGVVVSIVLRNGKLYRISENLTEVEMIPVGINRFGYKGRPLFWQFYLDENQEISDILFTTHGIDFAAWRLGDN